MNTSNLKRSWDDIIYLLARLLGLFLQGNPLFNRDDDWFLIRRRLKLCTLIIPLKR